MDNFLHILAVWTHVFGIALFVGPQLFLAFAAVPAARRIEDLAIRAAAMRTMTRRFGYIGGAGLLLIAVAGTYLIFTWRDYYAIPDATGLLDLRYGLVFVVKMVLVAAVVAVVGVHTFVIGPRQLALMDAEARGEAVAPEELARLRKLSMLTSIAGLLLALVVMVMGATLTTTSYSFQEA